VVTGTRQRRQNADAWRPLGPVPTGEPRGGLGERGDMVQMRSALQQRREVADAQNGHRLIAQDALRPHPDVEVGPDLLAVGEPAAGDLRGNAGGVASDEP